MKASRKKILISIGAVLAAIVVILAVFPGLNGRNSSNESDSQTSNEINSDDAAADSQGTDLLDTDSQDSATEATPPADIDPEAYKDPTQDIETRIESLLSQMTLEEKAAQMIQPEQANITTAQITKYSIGTVLSGGGSAPSTGNTVTDWQTHINDLKQAALDSRLGIPLLYGIDAVHGNNNVYGATMFPHNIGLGAAYDPELMQRIGEVVAKEVRATGIQWTFAPTLGNPQTEYWGRTYECFAEDITTVTELSEPLIAGFEGTLGTDSYLDASHVLATAKHYIGEGYTMLGVNQGNINMDEDAFDSLLHDELLTPYRAAIDAGVLTVMASYNSVNGVKCHENSYLINDILKGELGFQGLVIGDYNGVQQIHADTYKEQIQIAVNSGIDILMEPATWEDCMNLIIESVNEGAITQERIDDAVRRILRVKFTAGLFEEEINSEYEQQLVDEFGGEEHRAVAREAVSESLVLLKNDEANGVPAITSLADAKRILVVGKKADDIGTQCGGWTISWQGMAGDITEGTTILEGLREVAGSDVTVDFSEDGTFTGSYDAVIVVVGEIPYAETNGDKNKDNLMLAKSDQALLTSIHESAEAANIPDVPVTTILLSGRPIQITSILDQTDALVMAWLPGTEGAGIADVLLGDPDFTGTLTYTWPENAADVTTKFEEGTSILYPYGYGLDKSGSTLN